MGYLAFWDTRVMGSVDVGARYDWCDPTEEFCDPGDAECCFRAVPKVEISLRRGSQGGPVVATTTTGLDGLFWLTDNDWQDVDYYVSVSFERDAGPSWMRVVWGGIPGLTTPLTVQVSESFRINQTITILSKISVNAYDDTTAWSGDLASIWTTAFDTHMAMEAEGETRHRMTAGSSNAYDRYYIRYSGGQQTGPSCPSDARLADSDARSRTFLPELLGHLFHSRVVGAANGVAVFPGYASCSASEQPLNWSESVALMEAIPSLISYITRWDPDLASSASLPSCDPTNSTLTNTNDCASFINNAPRALGDPRYGRDEHRQFRGLSRSHLGEHHGRG